MNISDSCRDNEPARGVVKTLEIICCRMVIRDLLVLQWRRQRNTWFYWWQRENADIWVKCMYMWIPCSTAEDYDWNRTKKIVFKERLQVKYGQYVLASAFLGSQSSVLSAVMVKNEKGEWEWCGLQKMWYSYDWGVREGEESKVAFEEYTEMTAPLDGVQKNLGFIWWAALLLTKWTKVIGG